QPGKPGVLHNPLNPYNGADPWLTYYDGNYYLAATTWTSELTMRKSPTLAGLKTAEVVQIYYETDPSRCCNMWAPEFDLLQAPDGTMHWYFYYTAGTAGTYDNQHSHVLESAGTDPMGPYTYKARLQDPVNDTWSIDGSVLQLDGSLYFLFSAFIGSKQDIFIAPMSNPWTISGERVLLDEPSYPWEASGNYVNEGPVALQHDGKTFVIYSASACSTPDYKLGMLTFTGDDPLQTSSWVKSPEPVFQRSDENGVYAPGHNGFFKSPDGTEDWLVYHANDAITDGCDGGRTTRVQKINWNDDGTPNFGIPLATDTEFAAPSGDLGIDPFPILTDAVLSRFKSYSFDNAYLRHRNFIAYVDFDVQPIGDSQFRIVPGLADPAAISIESANFPGFFLRHANNAIVLSPNDNSDTFKGDATWWIKPGLADETWISFEAYNQPNTYIGKKFGVMALVELNDSLNKGAREDATFLEEH
ncbi:MAG TPA: family 43 glycosylhydrolase, partial [Phototrophicaceae bacterium]|nr:family 43 glycosylhydrolase [Phototrophicaceae bacterium]